MIEVSDLRVEYGALRAVRGVDLTVGPGEAVGLVGESGCGKTSVVRALAGLLPPSATVRGSVRVDGTEMVGASEKALRAVRGRKVALVPQGAGLDPVARVDRRLVETLRVVGGLGRRDARDRAAELIEEVGLAPDLLRRYPHQLSGGQRQRIVVALGLACGADLLVADEPLSGLDARTEAGLLELLEHLRVTRGLGLLLVSHDLTGVLRHCGRVHVMYAGRIVESAATTGFAGTHPYSRGLLGAVAGLAPSSRWATIPGSAPAITSAPAGCTFAERCPVADDECRESEPALRAVGAAEAACHRAGVVDVPAFPALRGPAEVPGREPVVRCRDVRVVFGSRRAPVVALAEVDLEVHRGEVVGLAGESGSGKSTLARVLLGLIPAEGTVEVDGVDLRTVGPAALRELRGRIGFVHQDPYGALHPGMRVRDLVAEPLAITGATDREPRVRAALEAAGLAPDDVLDRFPGRLSGGQRQRVAIARAVVGEPVLLICDEATSMLDASTRAGIARTVRNLADDRGLAVLFVTHDLGEAVHLCDRLLVLRDGVVVDAGPPREVVAAPRSAFARDMVAAFTRAGRE